MQRTRAFTLLEVALIVAIIGMMLMMIVGYLLAPKEKGPLPPVAETTPIPSSPVSAITVPKALTTRQSTPAPKATPTSIELSPQSTPLFR